MTNDIQTRIVTKLLELATKERTKARAFVEAGHNEAAWVYFRTAEAYEDAAQAAAGVT